MFRIALGVTAILAAILAYVTVWVSPRLWLAHLEKDAPEPLRSMLVGYDAKAVASLATTAYGEGSLASIANCRKRGNRYVEAPEGIPGIENTRQRGALCLRLRFLRVALGCGSAFLCAIVFFSLCEPSLRVFTFILGGFFVLLAVVLCVRTLNYRLVWDDERVWYRNALGRNREFTWDEVTCVSRCPQELAVRFGTVRVDCMEAFADRAYEELSTRHGGNLVFEPPHGYYSRTELTSLLLVIPIVISFILAAFLLLALRNLDGLGSGPFEVTPTNVHMEEDVYHMTAPEHGPGAEWVWDDVVLGSADFVDVGRLREVERKGGTVLVWGYGSSIGTGTNNRFHCEQVIDQDGNIILSHDALVANRRMGERAIAVIGGLLVGLILLMVGVYSLYHYLRQRRLPRLQRLEEFRVEAAVQAASRRRRLL